MKREEYRFSVRDFDSAQIFTCGQAFRWHLCPDGSWEGVVGGSAVRVQEENGRLTVQTWGGSAGEAFWRRYFDLETDYGALKKALAQKDVYLNEAVLCGAGIRLLRQEPFETLISFIISANNNIPRIAGCIEKLCRCYGKPIHGPGCSTFYAFPEPAVLAALSADEISANCHTGYRSAYITEAAGQYLARSGDLSDPQTYRGVGPKVAACIELFTGIRRDAFPVDVWVRRVLRELYFDAEPGKKEIERFVRQYFGDLAGYAQQYLFYWRRIVGKNGSAAQDIVALKP